MEMTDTFGADGKIHTKIAGECIEYFRERPVFARLFRGFREKYLSYGYFAGTVVLRNLSDEDRADLEGFLCRNYHGKRSASIRADQFREALRDSRFGELSPEEVLRFYFGEELIGKKEREHALQQERRAVFEQAEKNFAGTPAAEWIRAVRENQEDAREEEQEEDRKSEKYKTDGQGEEGERNADDDCREAGNIVLCGEAGGSDKCRKIDDGNQCGKECGADADKNIPGNPEETGRKERIDASKRNKTWLRNRYRESGQDPEILEQDLNLGAAAINGFPCRNGEREYLAVFAARITGNPHAFDNGTRGGQLLELLILWELERTGTDVPGDDIFLTMRRQRQYLAVGILRDDMSNYAMLSGVRVWKKSGEQSDDVPSGGKNGERNADVPSGEKNSERSVDVLSGRKNRGRNNCDVLSGERGRDWSSEDSTEEKGGCLHAGMEGFRMEGEPVQVPLSVIAGWERVACPDNTIYIVENPSVYAMLCQKWHGRQACMCMNGQPRLAAVLVLDLLAKAGVTIYYSGDFDPEGLQIAQRVKQYYQGEKNRKMHFWHMTEDDCLASLSGETLDDRRVKMLERITDPELKKPAELLRERGVAGYQENIWERYCDFAPTVES